MSTSAVVMMVIAMVIIWGGFIATSLYSGKIKEEE